MPGTVPTNSWERRRPAGRRKPKNGTRRRDASAPRNYAPVEEQSANSFGEISPVAIRFGHRKRVRQMPDFMHLPSAKSTSTMSNRIFTCGFFSSRK